MKINNKKLAITALQEPRTLVREVKVKQGFKLPWKLIVKRLKAYERKPRAFSPGKLINNKRKEALPILALAFRNYSFTARAAILGG